MKPPPTIPAWPRTTSPTTTINERDILLPPDTPPPVFFADLECSIALKVPIGRTQESFMVKPSAEVENHLGIYSNYIR